LKKVTKASSATLFASFAMVVNKHLDKEAALVVALERRKAAELTDLSMHCKHLPFVPTIEQLQI
jgi:hypothetical protein